jgi:hypothetical protein
MVVMMSYVLHIRRYDPLNHMKNTRWARASVHPIICEEDSLRPVISLPLIGIGWDFRSTFLGENFELTPPRVEIMLRDNAPTRAYTYRMNAPMNFPESFEVTKNAFKNLYSILKYSYKGDNISGVPIEIFCDGTNDTIYGFSMCISSTEIYL